MPKLTLKIHKDWIGGTLRIKTDAGLTYRSITSETLCLTIAKGKRTRLALLKPKFLEEYRTVYMGSTPETLRIYQQPLEDATFVQETPRMSWLDKFERELDRDA